jgi:hypothetical protein
MNETMKQAWTELSKMLVEPTPIELDVFLRTWQRAIQAEREECAKVADDSDHVVDGRGYYDQLGDANATARNIATAIRARGQA